MILLSWVVDSSFSDFVGRDKETFQRSKRKIYYAILYDSIRLTRQQNFLHVFRILYSIRGGIWIFAELNLNPRCPLPRSILLRLGCHTFRNSLIALTLII